MKIAFVTCYKQPDYIRGAILRKAAAGLPDTEVLVIKNRHTGVLRYPEIFLRLIGLRLKHSPDVYVLTFRGAEILPFVGMLTWPKKLIYDELVHPFSWFDEPGRENKARLLPAAPLKWIYRLFLRRCKIILADTPAHATYNANLNQLPMSRYVALPVSANEQLFRPTKLRPTKTFRVFYIGNMLPLHGLQHVLEAAVMLKDLPIEFRLIGGKAAIAEAVKRAQAEGAHISYETWVPFDKIPAEIAAANLCLAGPFGKTTQANLVITGKTYQFLASGAPTLIGQTSASQKFIGKVNCLMVPLGNSAALTGALQWAYEHPRQLKIVGEKGRKLYQKEFSERVLTDQLAALFQRL